MSEQFAAMAMLVRLEHMREADRRNADAAVGRLVTSAVGRVRRGATGRARSEHAPERWSGRPHLAEAGQASD